MLSCFVCLYITVSAVNSFSSVSGQTLNESMVSAVFKSEGNSTVEVFDGEHNGSFVQISAVFKSEGNSTVEVFDEQQDGPLISQQDKERIVWSKKILYPCLLFFGTFGNLMTIIIHKRGALTSPLSVFFVVLAVADLMLLYVNCFNAWLSVSFYFNFSRQHNIFCKLYVFIVYVSGVLSVWTLVAMTAQRAVCVLWPHRANVLCTVRRSKVIVASLVLFIAAIHSHLLYGHHVVTDSGGRRCTMVEGYEYFLVDIWGCVDVFIFSLLPWLCLAVSNSLLVWKLNVSVQDAAVSLGFGQADMINARKQKATSVTVTLIAVSSAFLVLTFPMSFMHILDIIHWVSGNLDYADSSPIYYYIWQISFPLWYANSCINFYIYCLTGSKFRREAKHILSCLLLRFGRAR